MYPVSRLRFASDRVPGAHVSLLIVVGRLAQVMDHDIVLLDQVELTSTSRRELDSVGTIRTVPISDQNDLLPAIRTADAVLYQLSPVVLNQEVLLRCVRLKVIGRIGIGMDQVDVDTAAECGMTVVNAAGAQATAVADHAMALMLCLARNVVAGHHALLAGTRSPPSQFMGCEMDGKTLGIIGFGAIGRRLAVRALGFGMVVQAYDPYLDPETIEQAGVTPTDLGALLERSDFISIHVPLTAETRHLIGADQLMMMCPHAYLINTSRGPVVDETALVSALRHGEIAGAGLDVFEKEPLDPDSPLIGLDRVVLTPHIGGWAREAQIRTQESVARDVARVLRGEPPLSPVIRSESTRLPVSRIPSMTAGRERGTGTPLPSIQPYVSWDETGLPHPSATHFFGTLPGLRQIIETEGPLTTERAYKLYVRGAGSVRVTKQTKQKLDAGVKQLEKQGKIRIDELSDSELSDQAQRIFRLPDSQAVVVRTIGDRDLYEVPLNEVANLMLHRLDRHPNTTHDQLMRHVLDTYGWKRLTEKARKYLTAAIRLT